MGKGMGGIPGGAKNMGNMVRQAERMQKMLKEAQNQVEISLIKKSAGGEAVVVTMNGKKEMISIVIRPEALDPSDIETLQDMIVAATNECVRQAEEDLDRALTKVSKGASLAGLI